MKFPFKSVTGWTFSRLSTHSNHSLPHCQLHEHFLHMQKHFGYSSATVSFVRGTDREQEQAKEET